jgi:hypothetical protein
MAGMKRLASIVLVVACTATGAATAAGPASNHTAVGTAAAKASLLTLADLGKGWTSKAGKTSGIQVRCTGYQPSGKGIVETGIASTPTFSAGGAGPFVVQETSEYATAAQASEYWMHAVTARLVTCARQSLSSLSSRGIELKVVSAGPLAVTKVEPMTAGFRVVATLSSATQKNLKTYLAWIFVGHGAGVTQIVVSSFQIVPVKYEYALALIADHHMSLPTA